MQYTFFEQGIAAAIVLGWVVFCPQVQAQVTVTPRLSAEQVSTIQRKVSGHDIYRAQGGPAARGEYLLDVGAGNAQEGPWWRSHNCQPNEQGPKVNINPGPNITGLLSVFDNSKAQTFFQTGYCKEATLPADAYLTVDQAILATLRSAPASPSSPSNPPASPSSPK